MTIIELDGPPLGKGRPRFRSIAKASRRFAMAYTPARTRAYENALRQVAALVMRGKPPMQGALRVTVQAFMPIPKSWPRKKIAAAINGEIRPATKPDVDNILKVLDALNGIVWEDDAQIIDARIVKAYSEHPRLKITVEQSGAVQTIFL